MDRTDVNAMFVRRGCGTGSGPWPDRMGLDVDLDEFAMLMLVPIGLTGEDGAMAPDYSIDEAKARFSEVIRRVREGDIVTVSYRGEPVAEIRPIGRRPTSTLDERLEYLERRGALVRPALRKRMFRPVQRRSGALARFLAERE